MAAGVGVLGIEDTSARRVDDDAGVARIRCGTRLGGGERRDGDRTCRRPARLAGGEEEEGEENKEAGAQIKVRRVCSAAR